MKTTGDGITAAAEFSTGVKNGQNYLNGRDSLGWVNRNWDASAVVLTANPAILGDGDFDGVAVAGEGFVN